jgi:hypothetical protein
MFTHIIVDSDKKEYQVVIDYEIHREPELYRHGRLLEPGSVEVEYTIIGFDPIPNTTTGIRAVAGFCNRSDLIEQLCLDDDKRFQDNIREDFTYE